MQPDYIIFHDKSKNLEIKFKEKIDQETVTLHSQNEGIIGEVFPDILEWRCQNLTIQSCKKENIIKEISSIKFPSLIKLYLTNDKIQSIEALSQMYFSLLQTLFLNNNNISKIKNLRKLFLPSIQDLRIHGNDAISDTEELQRISATKMKALSVHGLFSSYPQISNANLYLKFENPSLNNLCMGSDMQGY